MRRRLSPAAAVADLLLETLRLRSDPDVADLGHRWACLNPIGLASLVEYEGCVLWLYERLRELGIWGAVPTEFAEWLSARAHRVAAHNLLVDAQRDDLVRLLNEFALPHVLLKGSARRLLGYPHGGARRTSDVDVLLPEEVARPAWRRLQAAGFVAGADAERRYEGRFHLAPLSNGRAVAVELHTSTSNCVTASAAWRRVHGSARVVSCKAGPTRVPGATELLWHAIAHAQLPFHQRDAFRIRFLQDAAVDCAAGAEVDWSEIATRLASAELPNNTLAQRWLGAAAQLTALPEVPSPLSPLPALDFSKVLSWRLSVFRLLDNGGRRPASLVWGRHPVSRGRRLLIDEGLRAELNLPSMEPRDATSRDRLRRRIAAMAAQACYRAWCSFSRT
jgi:hypothetical protein